MLAVVRRTMHSLIHSSTDLQTKADIDFLQCLVTFRAFPTLQDTLFSVFATAAGNLQLFGHWEEEKSIWFDSATPSVIPFLYQVFSAFLNNSLFYVQQFEQVKTRSNNILTESRNLLHPATEI